MIVASWNIRGMNDPSKTLELQNMILKYKVHVLCLIDTRVRENNINEVIQRACSRWQWVTNYLYSPKSRLCLG